MKVLDIPEISLSKESGTTNMINDPVDNIIQTFDNHHSIRGIRGHISQIEVFSFNNVNETQMETEINELNPNKASGMDDIPNNILKESVEW